MTEKPERFWVVMKEGTALGGQSHRLFGNYNDAQDEAKKRAANNIGTGFFILESVGYVQLPVPPEIKVVPPNPFRIDPAYRRSPFAQPWLSAETMPVDRIVLVQTVSGMECLAKASKYYDYRVPNENDARTRRHAWRVHEDGKHGGDLLVVGWKDR